jgi:hypothetical protein
MLGRRPEGPNTSRQSASGQARASGQSSCRIADQKLAYVSYKRCDLLVVVVVVVAVRSLVAEVEPRGAALLLQPVVGARGG